jgi:hypothetical protein
VFLTVGICFLPVSPHHGLQYMHSCTYSSSPWKLRRDQAMELTGCDRWCAAASSAGGRDRWLISRRPAVDTPWVHGGRQLIAGPRASAKRISAGAP